MGPTSRRWVTRRRNILVGPATGNSGWSRRLVSKQFDRVDVTIGFVPRSLVGGVMAHQDDAGLRSVKYPVTLAADLCRAPFGEVRHVCCPGGDSRTARPTAGITPVVVTNQRFASLGRRGADSAPWSLSSASHAECGSAPVLRTIAVAPSSGMERLTLESKTGCCLFRERAGQTRRSKGDPGAARRVQESRLSWRLSADWSSFGGASEQST